METKKLKLVFKIIKFIFIQIKKNIILRKFIYFLKKVIIFKYKIFLYLKPVYNDSLIYFQRVKNLELCVNFTYSKI